MYEWYISDILEQFFALLMKERELGWLQQDGATAHTARVSMQAVQGVSGDCIISRGLLPPSSPDFYLRGKLKSSCVWHNPVTTGDLRKNISNGLRCVQPDELARVFSNMQRRSNLCFQVHSTTTIANKLNISCVIKIFFE